MTSAIFSQALREYLRLRRLWPWLFLSLCCFGLAVSWKFFNKTATSEEQYVTVTSMLVFRLLALASAIFTTAIIAQEVEQRTIVYLLTRPVPRWQLLLTRFAASVLVVTLLGVIGAVLTSWGAYGVGGANPLLGRDIVALAVGAASYGALFLFVSLLFNRSLILCILFAFGWETSIPSLKGDLFRLSIFSYLQAIADHPKGDSSGAVAALTGGTGSNDLTAGAAYLTMGLMIVALLAGSAWWFTHFEFVPREDAE